MSKSAKRFKALKELNECLTPKEIGRLQILLNFPTGVSEEVGMNGVLFISALKNWKDFDPYKFDVALRKIRPDLIQVARKLEWLSCPDEKLEKPISTRTFVELLTNELTRDNWILLTTLEAKKIVTGREDVNEMIQLCMENGIITRDLELFCETLAIMNRGDLAIKVLCYESVFQDMSYDRFQREMINVLKQRRTGKKNNIGQASSDLADALSHREVREIIAILDPPPDIFRDVKDGDDLLQSLFSWEERDPDLFIQTLSSIRPDLVPTAKRIEWLTMSKQLPKEILSRGKEFVEEYRRACEEGSQEIKFYRLMIVGPEGVGKTSLLKALRNQPFEEREVSTEFIEKTDITITDLSKDWSKDVKFKDRLKETRDDSVAHLAVQSFKSSSKDFSKIMDPPPNKEKDSTNETDPVVKEPKVLSPRIDLGSNASEFNGKVPVESERAELVRSKSEEKSDLNSEDLPLKFIQEHWKDEQTMDPIEFFTVWDLAGQSYLFCMHSLFLTPRAVYIIPIDLSVNLEDKIAQRERKEGRMDRRELGATTYFDIILYWIETIYSVSRSSSDDEPKSRIIIVFTKSDQIDNSKEKAKQDFLKIKNFLVQKTNCMSIVDDDFQVVSAKERNTADLEQLKEVIHKNAASVQFNFALPIRWLDFALKIFSFISPVLGESDIVKIADEAKCKDDYVEVLQFFHSIGVFYFRTNILFKSLPNLLDIILHIVAPSYCYDWEEQPDIIQDIEKATQNAILSRGLLDLILSRNSLLEVKSEIVHLLEEFGVILSEDRDSVEEYYYIPYLFSGDLSTIYTHNQNDLILYIHFPDGLLPSSFYFAFISLCIKEIHETGSVLNLAFDCMRFEWEDKINWIIDFTQHQPYIRIILQGIVFSQTTRDITDQILQIEQWIGDIQQDLILSAKKANIVLHCPCGTFPQTLSPCVYFDTYQKCSDDETHFHCKAKQKDYSWTYFDKQISPFRRISPEFMKRFLEKHRYKIIEKSDSKFLRAMSTKNLITGEEFRKFNTLNKSERLDFLQQIIKTKPRAWSGKFYEFLKLKNVHEILTMFESFILQSLKSDSPVAEDLSFARYPFQSNPCGICLVVNNENFKQLRTRNGSHVDFLNVMKTFENINFLIHPYEDLTRSDFLKIIENLGSMDHSKFDVFFCIIMSHGNENDDIYMTEDSSIVTKEEIMGRFTANKCPNLINKPKVFIIQACRGESHDKGCIVETHTTTCSGKLESDEHTNKDSSSTKEVIKKVSIHADFYMAHSTVKDHVSYRSKEDGTLFIRTLCDVLPKLRYTHHLGDIMMKVRGEVANIMVGKHVQCTEATDTLTKKLFLS